MKQTLNKCDICKQTVTGVVCLTKTGGICENCYVQSPELTRFIEELQKSFTIITVTADRIILT